MIESLFYDPRGVTKFLKICNDIFFKTLQTLGFKSMTEDRNNNFISFQYIQIAKK